MTAFAILGSSGAAYRQGIGIFGMMATSSCLVIPLTLFYIGTRLWAVGKRFGHMTQVAFFRDRFECSTIGTLIFVLTAAMLLPYLIISIVGGGTILQALTEGKISYPAGGAIVALVVMGTVFFGGMRGAVWVNVLQTLLFLSFGAIAFVVIGHNLPHGGISGAVQSLLTDPRNKLPAAPGLTSVAAAMARPATLLTRERIPWQVFLSFLLIPLSSIMFPHMSIMCFTARKVTAFRQTVVLYPLCIMLIWLPCVFLGALAFSQPSVTRDMAGESEELHGWLENHGKPQPGALVTGDLTRALQKSLDPSAIALLQNVQAHGAGIKTTGDITLTGGPAFISLLARAKDPALKPYINKIAGTNDSSVLLKLLKTNVAPWLAGILAAGIISAVMGSDCHQILALSTMFTKDVFDYYGKGSKITEATNVLAGRVFIVVLNSVAYVIALGKPQIFELATSYAFAGFAALSPIMFGALFWRRATKYGVLASTLWVIAWVLLQIAVGQKHLAPNTIAWDLAGLKLLTINAAGGLSFYGYTLVVPMTIGSAILMWAVSLLTPPPSRATIDRYFPATIAGART